MLLGSQLSRTERQLGGCSVAMDPLELLKEHFTKSQLDLVIISDGVVRFGD